MKKYISATVCYLIFFLCLSFPSIGLAQTSFTYDTRHRLTRANYENGNSIVYSYDNAGNRLGVTQTTASPSGLKSTNTSKQKHGAALKESHKGVLFFAHHVFNQDTTYPFAGKQSQ